MAASTVEEFKLFVGGVKGVSDQTISAALDLAKRHVVREGISEVHEDFGDLQNAWAAHLLEIQGSITSAALTSKSVGDVSTAFAAKVNPQTWFDYYKIIRQQVIGFAGRLGNNFNRYA